jgi:hypothetical protein
MYSPLPIGGAGETHLQHAVGNGARVWFAERLLFNGDATLTSALLDRLLDHVETVLIEGKSYRGQAHTEP